MAKGFGSFYAEYLKLKTNSIWVYVSGVVSTNKLGFYKFITCDNETSENTGRSSRHFIEVVGLPYSLHLDDHSNFKDGIFKQLLWKFGVFRPSLSHIHLSRIRRNLKSERLRDMHGI